MIINVNSGVGVGPNAMCAFDQAAYEAARISHNMIYLSSFIPPGATIRRGSFAVPPIAWGQKLYVVIARQDAALSDQEAWAGIGWVQDETGRGMFVEHHGDGEEEVHAAISTSLNFMMDQRNDRGFGPIQYEVTGTRCTGSPVCAVAIAAYETDNWNSLTE